MKNLVWRLLPLALALPGCATRFVPAERPVSLDESFHLTSSYVRPDELDTSVTLSGASKETKVHCVRLPLSFAIASKEQTADLETLADGTLKKLTVLQAVGTKKSRAHVLHSNLEGPADAEDWCASALEELRVSKGRPASSLDELRKNSEKSAAMKQSVQRLSELDAELAALAAERAQLEKLVAEVRASREAALAPPPPQTAPEGAPPGWTPPPAPSPEAQKPQDTTALDVQEQVLLQRLAELDKRQQGLSTERSALAGRMAEDAPTLVSTAGQEQRAKGWLQYDPDEGTAEGELIIVTDEPLKPGDHLIVEVAHKDGKGESDIALRMLKSPPSYVSLPVGVGLVVVFLVFTAG
jgi:chorismate mutase